MILQYVLNRSEYYCEADCISLQKVDLKEIKERTQDKIIKRVVAEIPVLTGSTIIDVDGILSKNLESENTIKVAVLSNGRERKDNTIWAFREDTAVFLLNNSGKTIKKF